MLILTIRTDKPESEIGLFDNDTKVAYHVWEAHRQLAETIHQRIEDLLKSQAMEWQDVKGIVGFEGPGSFTGLRIGLTVANSLAYGLSIPIVGSQGDNWINTGITKLLNGTNDNQIIPHYGAPVHITEQKK